MIQDIHGIYHNEYQELIPEQDDCVMFVQGRSVLMSRDSEQTIRYITYGELRKASGGDISADACRYLFSIENQGITEKYFLGNSHMITPQLMEKYEGRRIKDFSAVKQSLKECVGKILYANVKRKPRIIPIIFRTMKPEDKAFAGITACQLANWYENTQFCGKCGTRLEHDKVERMMKCPKCGAMHYPKISPAVIVAVTNGDKILMTKYAGRDYKKYALIAGFTEIGETIEDTVRREVMEEVGIHVKNIRYYKSQPWSFTDTILMGFYCELDGEDTITMDAHELSVAEWIQRENIPTEYDGISLTNEMIMRFKEEEDYEQF